MIMATLTILVQYLLLLDQPLAKINSRNSKTSQHVILRCWCAAETTPRPLAANPSERSLRAMSTEKKAMKKQFCQSHEDQIDNTRYPCCGMVVGPGEGKGCTSTHPCCGAAQVSLFCFWLCKARSTVPSANATMFSVGIRRPNSWGLIKKWVCGGQCQCSLPLRKCGPYSREIFPYLFFCWELNPMCMNWILQKSYC